MTTAPAIELRTFTTLDAVRGDLLDVYAEVRAPLLHLPNYAITAFGSAWTATAPSPASSPSSHTRTASRSAMPTPTGSSTETGTGSAPPRHQPTSTPSSLPSR